MKDMLIDIEEMLMEEMSVDRIVEKTGAPLNWILEVKRNLIQDSMDYVHSKTFRCSD